MLVGRFNILDTSVFNFVPYYLSHPRDAKRAA
jgi:hypothetical protein